MMLSDNNYGHRRHFTTHKYSFLFSCCTYIAVFIFIKFMMLSGNNYVHYHSVHSENEGRHLSFHMCPKNDALGQQLSAINVSRYVHCKCLQGITGTLQGNWSAGISNLWGLHVYPQSL